MRFTGVDDGTKVELVHRGWERLGVIAEERRQSHTGPLAWGSVLDHYAAVADAR